MSLLKGPITYTRMFVEGVLADSFHEKFIEAIQLRRFQPLTVEGEPVQSVGWVPVQNPLEDQVSFNHDDVFFNSYLNLMLRIDEWRIPTPLLKAQLAEATKKMLAQKGRERLSRRETEELKVMVSRKLRKSLVPVSRVYDLSWNLSEGVARFGNQSTKNLDLVMDLFEKTFPMRLVPASPYTLGTRAKLPSSIEGKLAHLEPFLVYPVST